MNNTRAINGTGYDLYSASISQEWNSTMRFPTLTYDLVASNGGVAINNLFNNHEGARFCDSDGNEGSA